MKSYKEFILSCEQFAVQGTMRYGARPGTQNVSGGIDKALSNLGTTASTGTPGKTGLSGSGSVSYNTSVGSRTAPRTQPKVSTPKPTAKTPKEPKPPKRAETPTSGSGTPLIPTRTGAVSSGSGGGGNIISK